MSILYTCWNPHWHPYTLQWGWDRSCSGRGFYVGLQYLSMKQGRAGKEHAFSVNFIWNNKTKDKNKITATATTWHKHLKMIKQHFILKRHFTCLLRNRCTRQEITLHVLFYAGKEPFCVRMVMETILCLMFMYNTHQRIVLFSFKQIKLVLVKRMCCLYTCIHDQ